MQTLYKSDNTSVMIRMLEDRYFPFIYIGDGIEIGEKDFSGLG